jgi:hypothetical protein
MNKRANVKRSKLLSTSAGSVDNSNRGSSDGASLSLSKVASPRVLSNYGDSNSMSITKVVPVDFS